MHGWESGLDASPLYDAAYLGVNRVPVGPVTENLYLELYPKFEELIISYAREHWNRSDILARKHASRGNDAVDNFFVVEDVGVNAVWIRGFEILANLAAEIGDMQAAAECAADATRLRDVLLRDNWDKERGRFVSWWRRPDGKWDRTATESVQSLFPVMLELPALQRSALLRSLTNTSKFWTPYPIPSVSKDDSTFSPSFSESADLMWRGPSWGFPNWFVLEGLLRHDQTAIAHSLVSRWAATVSKNGVWEMWSPLTGDGAGVPGLGMSTLIVDAMVRTGLVNVSHVKSQ
jgi:glycogen debranching enzyme